MILEGLNVLQVGRPSESATEFVSDYFDFSIYIDADEAHIEEWYVQRFMKLRDTVFKNPDSFFRHYAALSHDEAIDTAKFIWREINGKNLRENIAPTKARRIAAAQGSRPSRHRRLPAPPLTRAMRDEPSGAAPLFNKTAHSERYETFATGLISHRVDLYRSSQAGRSASEASSTKCSS